MEHVAGWAKGTDQSKCLFYLLRVFALSTGLVGILLFLIVGLQHIGKAQPLFAPKVALWWGVLGLPWDPSMTIAVTLVTVAVITWLSSQLRLVLNVSNVFALLALAAAIGVASTSGLVSTGTVSDDLLRLWFLTPKEDVCALQRGLRCTGLTIACQKNGTEPTNRSDQPSAPFDLSSLDSVELHVRVFSWKHAFGSVKTVLSNEQCVDCTPFLREDDPTPYEGFGHDRCLELIEMDAGLVVLPFAIGVSVFFLVVVAVLTFAAQPMGIGFAYTTFLLTAMTLGFACYRYVFHPSGEELVQAQRWVVVVCNFVATQLSVISIAGLHWKDDHQYPGRLRRAITYILLMVPIFATASIFSLLLPQAEEFFGVMREVYCTLLLWQLVNVWDHAAPEAVPILAVKSSGKSAEHKNAEKQREREQTQVKMLVAIKVIFVDLNGYFLAGLYPDVMAKVFVWIDVVLFSVILAGIHTIFQHLPQLHETGEGQFYSIKAIVSFMFFEFGVLKLLDLEGLQSVMVGEMYIAIALVGLAGFQLYTWLWAPLGAPLHVVKMQVTSNSRSNSRSYGTTLPSGLLDQR
ncbi:hypothetical protein DIPPA_33312 [Diplonema papillatum]|nr:hypothetical protein DIPPA_33312 [Diplonema papillatum]